MIHYIEPSLLESLNKFSKLFDAQENFGMSEMHSPKISEFYVLLSSYKNCLGSGSGHGAAIDNKKIAAAVKSMGESIERYALALIKPDFSNYTYEDLKRKRWKVLDPASYKIYSDDQPVIKKGQAINMERTTKVDWVWFNERLTNNQRILLPYVFGSYGNRHIPQYFHGSTSGNGCGQSPEEALLSATYEFLERDAFLFYWLTQNTPKQISFLNSDFEMKNLFKKIERLLPKISFYHLKTDLKAHTVLAVFRGTAKSDPFFMISAACHLNPTVAIKKATLELLHCIKFFNTSTASQPLRCLVDFDNSIWDFMDHVNLYAFQKIEKAYQFLFPAKPEFIDYEELKNEGKGSASHQLKTLEHDIAKHGYRIYNKDITSRDIKAAGLYVYRAFSPDMISIEPMHKFRHLGCKRLYTLAKKMNLKRQPENDSELNPYPHPFP